MNIADKLFRGDTLGKREIGVEIEIEGNRLPQNAPMGWRVEYDGSLRGESYEYVFTTPVPRKNVSTLLTRLSDKFKEMNSEVYDTGRAGVHVHVNIRDLTRNQLFNFICLYLIFEDVLVDFCGKDRVGNLFCLRVKDAEYLIEMLEAAIETDNLKVLYTDKIRYAAINCKAICQYGSLEFRAMRSTMDTDVLNSWVEILLRLKDSSKMFTDPQDIVSTMSWEGGEGFANKIFGTMLSFFPNTDWESKVREGIRRAQPVAYASDWLEEPEVKEDKEEDEYF